MTWLKGITVAAAMALSVPALAQQEVACRDPLKPMLRAELFFGRNIGGRNIGGRNIGGRLGVTERQRAQFVVRELTSRFPDGLTVIDGKGQWRDGGAIVREPSKVVIVVTADDAAAHERIAAATAAYKKRFAQKSVGIVTRPVCAAF